MYILRYLPQRFVDATLETLDKEQFSSVFDYVQGMITELTSVAVVMEQTPLFALGCGLLLSGPPGVGKTWALAALSRFYIEYTSGKHRPFDCVFVTSPVFFSKYDNPVEVLWDSYRGMSFSDVYERVPWLVLNDLGKEYRGGKLEEQVPYKLGRLLRARSEANAVTHITTNLSLSGNGEGTLRGVYGESIGSLLAEMTQAFEITGPDRRRESK